jgi:succinyl-CoA synthetase beta subunit
MELHEHQAKGILAKFGVPSPPFAIISLKDKEEGHLDRHIEEALVRLGISQGVIKAQVLAGGRGKAGGILFAKSREEIHTRCFDLLGKTLVTPQTKKEGIKIEKIMISPFVDIEKELYIAVLLDRSKKESCLIGSMEGGMDIEEIAKTSPEKIARLSIPPTRPLYSFEILEFIKKLGFTMEMFIPAISLIQALTSAFKKLDATLIEINPLVITKQNQLVALDAKCAIDDNSLFRQKELAALFDEKDLSEQEQRARKADLSYVSMEGTIGCMVNGAGLAMATMDMIGHFGQKAANFLDVGGSATREKIAEGFRIILADPKVKGILVNIFGGIMNCETIAEGILEAAKERTIRVPIVVRMEGNNVEGARHRLNNSSLSLHVASNLKEAALEIAKAVR